MNSVGWKRVLIAEVCSSIIDCVNRTAPEASGVTPFKMIRTSNVRDGWIDLSSVKFVDEPTYLRWTRRQVPQMGDIVLTREAPLGEVGLIRSNDRVFLGQRLVSYRVDPTKADNRFLLYALQGEDLQSQIRAFGSGSTVEHMRVPDAKVLRVNLPSLETQRRIASILSAYDDLIENNTRRIAILEEMARRVYEEWFVHFRAPGCEDVELVGSPLGPVPKSWEISPLEDLCSRITDGAHHSPKTQSVGIPMASVKDMRTWDFDVAGCRIIDRADYEALVRNDCRPLKGDVLIAKDGSYLKHAFVVREERELVILSSIAILRPHESVSSDFLVQVLKDPRTVDRMKGVVSGVAIPRIILKDFSRFEIVFPPQSLRDRWDALVGPNAALCQRLFRLNANLRAQRDLLLPKLISGEIDVSQAEELMEAAE
ncbi:restriction endonuclease subunit S [Mesorhizobium sp. M0203]|uniref:restriction endonuclease subunit S n=1 Tax=Mesorhizobium sp. M0203 TaxID=2956912 RepID=UPI00333C2D1D